jgi:uncharacterized caspase-like protein
MALVVGQLVHTSFKSVGFRTLASTRIPAEIQEAFIQQIAYRYWDAYDPPELGYRAAYLHQLSRFQTLFGWLYSDGLDDRARNHVPCFIGYYLADALSAVHLEFIFDCLATGPLTIVERSTMINGQLSDVVIPDQGQYHSTRPGVKIPSRYRDYSYDLLRQGSLINFFLPVEVPLGEQQQKGWAKKLTAITTQLTTRTAPPTWMQVTGSSVTRSKPSSASPRLAWQGQRVALLIGVSDYGSGFETLPGVGKDLEILKHALENSAVGNFTSVETLLNPSPQSMAEAIQHLCLDRLESDLILLYFSGHGVRDPQGQIYLTTSTSRRGTEKNVVRSTTIPLNFLRDLMQQSQAKQQVVVLDCCFSEAIPGSGSFRQDRPVSAKLLLTGDHQTILLSSTATQHPFAQKGADHSIYTFSLVEGLETGAADLNQDGHITLRELHDYIKRKVQITSPALQPQIYGSTSSQQTVVAASPTGDAKLRYRMEAEQYLGQDLSMIDRVILDAHRERLGLTSKDAAVIEAEVFKPYQDYQIKLKEYALGLLEAIRDEYPLSSITDQRFQEFQDILGLTQAETAPIKSQVLRYADPLRSHRSRASSIQTAKQWQRIFQGWLEFKPTWLRLDVVVAIVVALGAVALGLQYLHHVQQSQQSAVTPGQLTSASNVERRWHQLRSKVLVGHQGAVWSLAISPDGQILASGSDDRRIKLWDVKGGDLLKTLPGHGSTVWSVAFSPDGQLVASGGGDASIQLWSISTGTLVRTLSGHAATVRSLSFTPDGQRVVSGSDDGTIRLWDVRTGKMLRVLTTGTGEVRVVAISPNGKTLVSGGAEADIQVWSLKTMQILRTLTGHQGRVVTLAISADSQRLISGSTDKTLKIWDLNHGSLLHTLATPKDWVNAVTLSPDQSLLAVGEGNSIQLWDVATGKLFHTFSYNPQAITALAFSRDGQFLISSSQDRIIKVWEPLKQ